MVHYDGVDDGARIYLINSKYPEGKAYFDPKKDVIKVQMKFVEVDFAEHVVEGENRLVIVKFDQSAPGSSFSGLKLTVED